MLQIIVMLKRTNSNLSTVYAIIPLDILVHELLVTLNTAVQALEMVLMLIQIYHNMVIKRIPLNNNKYYAYSSDMT